MVTVRTASTGSGPALEERIFRFIIAKSLFKDVKRIGIAVSGGSDSLSLMYLLPEICRKNGIVPVVLNFDHGIPGEHSDEDTVFVRETAAKLGLEFAGEQGKNICARDGKSLEMVAREYRQDFYRRMAFELDLDAIATGHQANDVAETLVLRLLRGAGAAGLSGMKPMSVLPPSAKYGGRQLRIIRPLLEIQRDELRDWLRMTGVSWREDPSNTNEAIQRNEVRRSILPAIARRGNGLQETISQLTRSAEILREEDDYLESLAGKWIDSAVQANGQLPIDRLNADLALPLRRRVLRKWLIDHVSSAAAGFSVVESMLSIADGGVLTLPGGHQIVSNGGMLKVVEHAEEPQLEEMPISVPGQVVWGRFVISADYAGTVTRTKSRINEWPAICTVSAKSIEGKSLFVRPRKSGDRIRPYGLNGSKKLQDVFTDEKLPADLRDTYPIITDGNSILWIPGYRISSEAAVRAGEKTVMISITETNPV